MRLLIVEDYLLVALALRALVQDIGHVVCGIAPCPVKAMRIARDPDISIQLALVDIRLENDTSGVDAAQELGQMGIPSIFLTAYAKDVEQVQGSLGVLYKPYSAADIKGTLEACQRMLANLTPDDVPKQFLIFDKWSEGGPDGQE